MVCNKSEQILRDFQVDSQSFYQAKEMHFKLNAKLTARPAFLPDEIMDQLRVAALSFRFVTQEIQRGLLRDLRLITDSNLRMGEIDGVIRAEFGPQIIDNFGQVTQIEPGRHPNLPRLQQLQRLLNIFVQVELDQLNLFRNPMSPVGRPDPNFNSPDMVPPNFQWAVAPLAPRTPDTLGNAAVMSATLQPSLFPPVHDSQVLSRIREYRAKFGSDH